MFARRYAAVGMRKPGCVCACNAAVRKSPLNFAGTRISRLKRGRNFPLNEGRARELCRFQFNVEIVRSRPRALPECLRNGLIIIILAGRFVGSAPVICADFDGERYE